MPIDKEVAKQEMKLLFAEVVGMLKTLTDNAKTPPLKYPLEVYMKLMPSLAWINIMLLMEKEAQKEGRLPKGEMIKVTYEQSLDFLHTRGDEPFDLVRSTRQKIAEDIFKALIFTDDRLDSYKNYCKNSLNKEKSDEDIIKAMQGDLAEFMKGLWALYVRRRNLDEIIEYLKSEGKPLDEANLGFLKLSVPEFNGLSVKDIKKLLSKEQRIQHSHMEGNLIEYPKAIYSKGKQSRFVEGNYVVCRNNGGEEIARIGSAYGHLEAFDENILRGVMSFLREVNGKYVCVFSDYQLLKALGLPTNAGIYYKKLQEAKKKVGTLDISITKFYAKTDEENHKPIEGYPLFKSRFLSQSNKRKEENPLNFNYFVLNDLFNTSIANKYLFYYDLRDYKEIGKPTAMRIWEYLKKKRGNKLVYMETLESFCKKIPIETTTLRFAKNSVKKNLALLKKKGFIKDFNFNTYGTLVIHFGRQRKRYYEVENFVGEQAKLFLDLTEQGVEEGVARDLIRKYDAKVIRFQLEALPFRNVEDKTATLVASIKGKWTAPDSYARKREGALVAEARRGEEPPKPTEINTEGVKAINSLINAVKESATQTTGSPVLDYIIEKAEPRKEVKLTEQDITDRFKTILKDFGKDGFWGIAEGVIKRYKKDFGEAPLRAIADKVFKQ